jgi:hypothetical protein
LAGSIIGFTPAAVSAERNGNFLVQNVSTSIQIAQLSGVALRAICSIRNEYRDPVQLIQLLGDSEAFPSTFNTNKCDTPAGVVRIPVAFAG